jgi:hypothetical protein
MILVQQKKKKVMYVKRPTEVMLVNSKRVELELEKKTSCQTRAEFRAEPISIESSSDRFNSQLIFNPMFSGKKNTLGQQKTRKKKKKISCTVRDLLRSPTLELAHEAPTN